MDGEPGVHSARFLGADASYPERFAEIFDGCATCPAARARRAVRDGAGGGRRRRRCCSRPRRASRARSPRAGRARTASATTRSSSTRRSAAPLAELGDAKAAVSATAHARSATWARCSSWTTLSRGNPFAILAAQVCCRKNDPIAVAPRFSRPRSTCSRTRATARPACATSPATPACPPAASTTTSGQGVDLPGAARAVPGDRHSGRTSPSTWCSRTARSPRLHVLAAARAAQVTWPSGGRTSRCSTSTRWSSTAAHIQRFYSDLAARFEQFAEINRERPATSTPGCATACRPRWRCCSPCASSSTTSRWS